MKKTALLVLSLSLIGCVEVQDTKQKHDEKQNVPQITYKIEALPEAQKYLIKFEGADSYIRITKLAQDSKEKSLEIEKNEDVVMQPGLHTYRVQAQGYEQFININVPRDFIIEGDYLVKDDDVVNLEGHFPSSVKLNVNGRMYFKAGSRLITGGRSIEIEAHQIFSEGARILTWPKDSKASGMDPGSSGGRIYLKGHELIGSLHFEMRGQDGSDGESWLGSRKKPQHTYNHGTNGGNTGVLVVEIQSLNAGRVTADFTPGKGGIGQDIMDYFDSKRVVKNSMGNGQDGLIEKSCLIVKNECQEFR